MTPVPRAAGPDFGHRCRRSCCPHPAQLAGRRAPGRRGSHGDLTLPAAGLRGPDRLLPTPRASDRHGQCHHGDGGTDLITTVADLPGPRPVDHHRWGSYAAAVARWEHLLGRAAPEPTQIGRYGKPVLAPPFVEWLMGLPDGWVTDPALGLPRTRALPVLGNGVVPQQAVAALLLMLCPHRYDRSPA